MSEYTAITKQIGEWWVGWIEEIPGVKIRQGLKDIEENRDIASEVLRQEIEQW